MSYKPGDQVLIRATVAADGKTVTVAPGVELGMASVDVLTDMPATPEGLPVAVILFFETPDDRQDFAETFQQWPGMEIRDLPL